MRREWVALKRYCRPTPWFTMWPRALCVRGCSSQVFVQHPIWIGRLTPTICVTSHRRKRFEMAAWFQDPFYRDEWVWYNPLLPGIIAGISYLTGLPVNIVASRVGRVSQPRGACQLLPAGPALDRPADRSGVTRAGLLFLVHAPTWAAPTYSPWLFGSVFAQSFFYLTLATYCAASVSEATSGDTRLPESCWV